MKKLLTGLILSSMLTLGVCLAQEDNAAPSAAPNASMTETSGTGANVNINVKDNANLVDTTAKANISLLSSCPSTSPGGATGATGGTEAAAGSGSLGTMQTVDLGAGNKISANFSAAPANASCLLVSVPLKNNQTCTAEVAVPTTSGGGGITNVNADLNIANDSCSANVSGGASAPAM